MALIESMAEKREKENATLSFYDLPRLSLYNNLCINVILSLSLSLSLHLLNHSHSHIYTYTYLYTYMHA